MITLRINIYLGMTLLIIFLTGCQTGHIKTSTVDMSDEHQAHSRDYHPHPFWESSYQIPDFGKRPEKRYGSPPAIPDLPDGLESLEPVTVAYGTHFSQGEKLPLEIRTFTRTSSRIQVDNSLTEQQWLFTQNPIDHRRFFGQLADHHEKAILEYHESDLGDAGIGYGWADIVTAGIPLESLKSFQPTGESEEKFGITFDRYLLTEEKQNGQSHLANELWWSDSHYLPLRVVAKNGIVLHEIIDLQTSVNESQLEDLAKRYPEYLVVDKADWKSCDPGLAKYHEDH